MCYNLSKWLTVPILCSCLFVKTLGDGAADLSEVKKILKSQAEDIALLKKTVGDQNNDLTDLRKENIALWMENAKQNDQITSLEKQNANLQSSFGKLCGPKTSGLHRDRRVLMTNPANWSIGFTARLSQHVTSLGNKATVVFDDTVSNFGSAYSTTTGIFTAPTSGTFFFFASIMSHANEYLETEIVVNGVRVALMYGYGNNRFDQGTNAAVVGLEEGDKVWVRHVGQEGLKVYGGTWSSFSGFHI